MSFRMNIYSVHHTITTLNPALENWKRNHGGFLISWISVLLIRRQVYLKGCSVVVEKFRVERHFGEIHLCCTGLKLLKAHL